MTTPRTKQAVYRAAMARYREQCKLYGGEAAYLRYVRSDSLTKSGRALIKACAADAKSKGKTK